MTKSNKTNNHSSSSTNPTLSKKIKKPETIDNNSKVETEDKINEKKEKEAKKSGFIFMCNKRTKPECYKHRIFAMPRNRLEMVERIKPGSRLFLFDFDLRLMYGVYKAVSSGGLNLVPEAFNGAFPAQVKFKIDKDCLPLPESTFKQAILENYDSNTKFQPDLNSKQVRKLLMLFEPVTVATQPSPPQSMDSRRAPSHTQLPPPSYPYRSTQLPPAHLPPLEDPYRSRVHLRPAHLPSSSENPYYVHPPPLESRYIPVGAPPTTNDPHYLVANYGHPSIPGAQPTTYAYQAENPIRSDGYRAPVASAIPATNPDPNATAQSREYYLSLIRREGGGNPTNDEVYQPKLLTVNANTIPQPQLPPSYLQWQQQRRQQQQHSATNVPVSSLYSFAGAAPLNR